MTAAGFISGKLITFLTQPHHHHCRPHHHHQLLLPEMQLLAVLCTMSNKD
jgi:hypothetical protein